MGFSHSKLAETTEIPMKETPDMNKTAESDVSVPETPTFSALRKLKSMGNKYEKFSSNSSMANLESPTGLKQRLIKALGGYSLMDPRSPSQVIARTPLSLKQKAAEVQTPPITAESMFDTTLDMSFKDEDPYRIFEEEQNDEIHTPKATLEEVIQINESTVSFTSVDPRSPTEGVTRTPLFVAETIEEAVDAVIAEKKATVPEVKASNTQTLFKSMYKDLIRRDPIYLDLLHDEDDELTGKTTPVKKATENTPKERTPLGCLGNRNLFNSTPIKGSNMGKNEFSDNFADKIERTTAKMVMVSVEDDENTPTSQQIALPKTLAMSKSKIPIRARRL